MSTEIRPNRLLSPRPNSWNVIGLHSGQRGSSATVRWSRVALHLMTMVGMLPVGKGRRRCAGNVSLSSGKRRRSNQYAVMAHRMSHVTNTLECPRWMNAMSLGLDVAQ